MRIVFRDRLLGIGEVRSFDVDRKNHVFIGEYRFKSQRLAFARQFGRMRGRVGELKVQANLHELSSGIDAVPVVSARIAWRGPPGQLRQRRNRH
jgi:hypothetical protein